MVSSLRYSLLHSGQVVTKSALPAANRACQSKKEGDADNTELKRWTDYPANSCQPNETLGHASQRQC